jgi:hypothetical protein
MGAGRVVSQRRQLLIQEALEWNFTSACDECDGGCWLGESGVDWWDAGSLWEDTMTKIHIKHEFVKNTNMSIHLTYVDLQLNRAKTMLKGLDKKKLFCWNIFLSKHNYVWF